MFSVKRSARTVSQTRVSVFPNDLDKTTPLPAVTRTTSRLLAPLDTKMTTGTLASSPEGSSVSPNDLDETAPLPVATHTTSRQLAPLDTKMITGTLASSTEGSAVNRAPIVIKSELKRPLAPPPRSLQARQKHSKRLWILGMLVLFTTIMATLLISTPQGQELSAKFSPNQMGNNVITHQQDANAAPAALATTTYMYQNDGYDPYAHGEVNVSDGANSLLWPYGQCTYWANYEYQKESGYWVQWTGNADQWFLGAQKAGWDYGQTPPPNIHSIIVLMPYVQGAGWLGHVAVVESQTGNVVHTSNMNWGYGGYQHVENVDFTIGAGVYFVWHKPAN